MDTKEIAISAARLASDKMAVNISVIEISALSSVADYLVLCSCSSDRQVAAMAEHIIDGLKKSGERPIGVEGREHARWVLIDYADVIVHVFHESEREYYDLDGLWADAPRIEPAIDGDAGVIETGEAKA